MRLDVDWIRAQFPLLAANPGLHYLDSAASAQVPASVIDAVQRFDTESRANVHRGVHRLAERATDAYEGARRTLARFLSAHPREIVFTGGCTAAINLVAQGYGALLLPGDEVVISELEHHSNIVPWQMLRDRRGIVLKTLPVGEDGRLDMAALERVVTKRCRLIALTHCSNVTGAVSDIGSIVDAAGTVGAKVLLDGAQRAPHGPIDLPELGVDFYAIAGHKMFGPTGIGVLWGREEALARMQPMLGGGGMIEQVRIERTTYADPPQRFEAGTPPIAGAVGLGAAAEWQEQQDWPALTQNALRLTGRMLDGLAGIEGTRIIGPTGLQGRIGIVSFALEGAHPHDVCQVLDARSVACRGGHHCTQPLHDRFGLAGSTRASLGPYSDDAAIDALIEGVAEARRIFA
ncbi:MAG: cysteine desulfurase [Proteobacteria bacterium]|nr:cysteine desulfurase [Pseudomonadota bacterium]MBI3499330.1 cysteine desulfurase [Pseudomonadota bacterium]